MFVPRYIGLKSSSFGNEKLRMLNLVNALDYTLETWWQQYRLTIHKQHKGGFTQRKPSFHDIIPSTQFMRRVEVGSDNIHDFIEKKKNKIQNCEKIRMI